VTSPETSRVDDELDYEEPPPAPASTATRVLVLTAAALAILLLGAAVGLLIKLPGGTSSDNPGPGPVEVGFAQDMSVHHQQAVTMANWARDHTQDPQIRQLAFDIESTQANQEGRLQGWLMLWGQPEQSPTGRYMAWMAGPDLGDMAGMPGMTNNTMPANGEDHMPGYATNAEIAKLQSLTGPAMDTYFLQLMLRHHLGGAPMAQFAADHATVPAVKVLAQNMLASQASEVTIMKQLLAERGVQPLPMN
jgi:uncharacterized protein (DUF305 family)